MSNEKETSGTRGGARVCLDHREQIHHWTTALGVTEEELAAAIQEVGDSAAMVAEYLRQQK